MQTPLGLSSRSHRYRESIYKSVAKAQPDDRSAAQGGWRRLRVLSRCQAQRRTARLAKPGSRSVIAAGLFLEIPFPLVEASLSKASGRCSARSMHRLRAGRTVPSSRKSGPRLLGAEALSMAKPDDGEPVSAANHTAAEAGSEANALRWRCPAPSPSVTKPCGETNGRETGITKRPRRPTRVTRATRCYSSTRARRLPSDAKRLRIRSADPDFALEGTFGIECLRPRSCAVGGFVLEGSSGLASFFASSLFSRSGARRSRGASPRRR